MNKQIIILITVLILSAFIGLFLINKSLLTGSTVSIPDYYTYTTALCNSSNSCQDNIIECKGNKTLSITPISGAIVQHLENWENPNKSISNLCDKT